MKGDATLGNFIVVRAHIYISGAVILAVNHNDNENIVYTGHNTSMDGASGHEHSGDTGDGPPIPAVNIPVADTGDFFNTPKNAESIIEQLGAQGLLYLLLSGARAMTGDLNLGSHLIHNVVDPAAAQDAATKNYVDTSVSGAAFIPLTNSGNNVSDPTHQQDVVTAAYANSHYDAIGAATAAQAAAEAASDPLGSAATAQANSEAYTSSFFPVSPNNGGTGNAAFLQGSVVYVGLAGVYQQDSGHFYYDDVNKRLGIGTGTPSNTIDVFNATNCKINASSGVQAGVNAIAGGLTAGLTAQSGTTRLDLGTFSTVHTESSPFNTHVNFDNLTNIWTMQGSVVSDPTSNTYNILTVPNSTSCIVKLHIGGAITNGPTKSFAEIGCLVTASGGALTLSFATAIGITSGGGYIGAGGSNPNLYITSSGNILQLHIQGDGTHNNNLRFKVEWFDPLAIT